MSNFIVITVALYVTKFTFHHQKLSPIISNTAKSYDVRVKSTQTHTIRVKILEVRIKTLEIYIYKGTGKTLRQKWRVCDKSSEQWIARDRIYWRVCRKLAITMRTYLGLIAIVCLFAYGHSFQIRPRIVNGDLSDPQQFQYYVRFSTMTKHFNVCGGVLISDR